MKMSIKGIRIALPGGSTPWVDFPTVSGLSSSFPDLRGGGTKNASESLEIPGRDMVIRPQGLNTNAPVVEDFGACPETETLNAQRSRSRSPSNASELSFVTATNGSTTTESISPELTLGRRSAWSKTDDDHLIALTKVNLKSGKISWKSLKTQWVQYLSDENRTNIPRDISAIKRRYYRIRPAGSVIQRHRACSNTLEYDLPLGWNINLISRPSITKPDTWTVSDDVHLIALVSNANPLKWKEIHEEWEGMRQLGTVGARDRTQNAILARYRVLLKKCFLLPETTCESTQRVDIPVKGPLGVHHVDTFAIPTGTFRTQFKATATAVSVVAGFNYPSTIKMSNNNIDAYLEALTAKAIQKVIGGER